MTRYKLMISIGLLATALLGIFIVRSSTDEDSWICIGNQWTKHGNPTTEKPTMGCGENSLINFNKSGYISDREPNQPNTGMYLIYEEPGKPALSMKLKFDEKSDCVFNEEKTTCISLNSTIEKATENKRVSIQGFEYGGIVLVKNLNLEE